MTTQRLIHGDCLDVLRGMPAESVDAIVTDPPYGLGFMGKEWDAPGMEWAGEWAELCLRVIKPGGHIVAFGGTRTVHRIAVALEDAGWEIRDTVSWLYWSGFPKSHDVSKAMDKLDGGVAQRARRLRFTAWVRSTGLTSRQINEATGTHMGSHYTTAKSQPAVMTREHLEAVRPLIGDVPAWVEEEVDRRTVESETYAARGVVTVALDPGRVYGTGTHVLDHGTPQSPEAVQWNGWGTALKPAQEPAILARKPMVGTTTDNVLCYGTGAINIDACRYRFGDPSWPGPQDNDYLGRPGNGSGAGSGVGSEIYGARGGRDGSLSPGMEIGRFPANIYACPKASRSEREAGCEALPPVARAETTGRAEGSPGLINGRSGRTAEGVRNHHPTVKPVRLMRWLVRLVTPPGGVVVDTFMGSGTTGLAAVAEGVNFVGIEREEDFMRIAAARVQHVSLTQIECPDWARPPEKEQRSLWGA